MASLSELVFLALHYLQARCRNPCSAYCSSRFAAGLDARLGTPSRPQPVRNVPQAENCPCGTFSIRRWNCPPVTCTRAR